MVKDLIYLARPHQYTKNLFVLLPAFFAFKLNNPTAWKYGILAFIGFSLIASSVYILNDWIDRVEDRNHPDKKSRPIAAGRIKKITASIFMLVLLVLGLTIGYTISATILGLLALYYVLNLAYTFKLKHIPLIDISVIALGFVIRLLVGAEATDTVLSHWIIVITFLLALFLALAKRRDDILVALKTEKNSRKVIEGYNIKLLDMAMSITSSIVIVAYILWSLSEKVTEMLYSQNVYMTSLFVLLGILRYMQITFVEESSGDPSKTLVKDTFLQLVLVCWLLSFVWIIYI